jgi:hypothetical protein
MQMYTLSAVFHGHLAFSESENASVLVFVIPKSLLNVLTLAVNHTRIFSLSMGPKKFTSMCKKLRRILRCSTATF